MGGGACDCRFLTKFYIEENLIHRTKYQSFKKIELKENVGKSVVYYLKVIHFRKSAKFILYEKYNEIRMTHLIFVTNMLYKSSLKLLKCFGLRDDSKIIYFET